MSMYTCVTCKKEFKTTQHLEQHKNRKKICIVMPDSINASLTDTIPLLKNNDLSSNDIMKFISTYNTFQDLIKDKELVEEYKKTIMQLKKENTMLKHQLHLINKVIKNSTETIIKENTEQVVKESAHIAVEKIINKDDNTLILLNKNNDDDDDLIYDDKDN